MLCYGLGSGFNAWTGVDNLKPWLKYQRPPHTSATYFKRTITSTNWRPIPIGIEGLVQVIERSVSEPSINVSDSVERGIFRAVSVSEPGISVSDTVALIVRRVREISEPTISVVDAVECIRQRIMDVSESPTLMSDEVTAEKIITQLKERGVLEDLGILTDSVDVLKLLPWLTGVFEDKSEVTVIGCQSSTMVTAAQIASEVKGAAVRGTVE